MSKSDTKNMDIAIKMGETLVSTAKAAAMPFRIFNMMCGVSSNRPNRNRDRQGREIDLRERVPSKWDGGVDRNTLWH